MRKAFHLQSELRKALDWVLADLAKPMNERQALWSLDKQCNYFTATELVRRVRAAGCEIMRGLPYGKLGASELGFGSDIRIRLGGGTDLLTECRKFLRGRVLAGELRRDSPGRDRPVCASGLRFRLAHLDLTDAEKRTLVTNKARRERGPIRHFRIEQTKFIGDQPYKSVKALCQLNRTRKGFSCYRRKPLRTTDDREKVTCKPCLKLLASGKEKSSCATAAPVPTTAS